MKIRLATLAALLCSSTALAQSLPAAPPISGATYQPPAAAPAPAPAAPDPAVAPATPAAPAAEAGATTAPPAETAPKLNLKPGVLARFTTIVNGAPGEMFGSQHLDKLPVKMDIHLKKLKVRDQVGYEFEAYLRAEAAGRYRFAVTTSMTKADNPGHIGLCSIGMSINDTEILPAVTKTIDEGQESVTLAGIDLEPGVYPVKVTTVCGYAHPGNGAPSPLPWRGDGFGADLAVQGPDDSDFTSLKHLYVKG